jgi:hypothetical protein
MASAAVFIALGSGAYAAATLPRNSVGNAQLRTDAVDSPRVRDGSLLATDFKAGELPRGPKGDRGNGTIIATAITGQIDPDPVLPDEQGILNTTITTGATSKLLLRAKSSDFQMQCAGPASCALLFGLYIDGKPVRGSGRVVGAEAGETVKTPVLIWAEVPDVPAGTHRIVFTYVRRGLPSSYFGNDSQIEAIAVGS